MTNKLASTLSNTLQRRRFLGAAALGVGALAGAAATERLVQGRSARRLRASLSGQFFDDPTFDFQARIVLGSAYYRCANPGKVFAILSQIEDGNPESAFQAFFRAGAEAREWAMLALGKGHRVSAREAFLWAANYLYTALYFLDGSSDSSRMSATWQAYFTAWRQAAALFTPAVERADIPYEGTTLTGWFYRVNESRKARGLIIINNGADGSDLDLYSTGAAGGLARGYNCLTFNGPGQGDAFWVRKQLFRPDWEKVISPVVDFAVSHPEVDPERIALVGVSQGGYFVPRALAFEHRIRAGVADPGVWDVGALGSEHLPGQMKKLLDTGGKAQFDQEMAFALKLQPRTRDMLDFRMRPYGATSYFDFLRALQSYRLEGVAERIRCPMLVTNPASEQFFKGQPQRLYDALTCQKTLLNFSLDEGAAIHCELNAPGYRDFRIYDWLDEQLA